jgi:hypothetical protein
LLGLFYRSLFSGGDDIDDMDEEEILKRAQELSQQKPEPIEEEGQGAKQEGNKGMNSC